MYVEEGCVLHVAVVRDVDHELHGPARSGRLDLVLDAAGKSTVAAHSVPCVRETPEGVKELIFHNSSHGIAGIDPLTGKENWGIDIFRKRSVSSPILVGGFIIGTNGSGNGGNYVVGPRTPNYVISGSSLISN